MQSTNEIGSSRRRLEDPALLTGEARYADDFRRPDAAHLAVRRSQQAHATIEEIDVEPARRLDGVHAVFTARDLDAADVPGVFRVTGAIPEQRATEYSILARDKVRFTGEPVVAVVAEDRYLAREAADRVEVEYSRLDPVTTTREAMDPDAPVLHEEHPDNLAIDWEFGDAAATDDAFEAAAHVEGLSFGNQRLVPDPMEPRAVIAEFDASTDRVTVHASTQSPTTLRSDIAVTLDLPEERIRVVAPAVGGGFGAKGSAPYAEEPLAAWASIQLERPVKWTATRSETHRVDRHGRGVDYDAEAAVDADGNLLGLRFHADMNIGAYLSWGGKTQAFNYQQLASGAYAVPAIHATVQGAFTNTAPTGPYRGAGRPEIIHAVERLVRYAADRLGHDPVEFRRRNLIPPDEFPYETAAGITYDSGDYEPALDRALDLVGYESLRDRQADLRERDRYLGIGLATFVENTGTGPGVSEAARVEVDPSGRVTAYCGTADHGQGHATTFTQIVADELGVPPGKIDVEEGDSDAVWNGAGTFGSRSVAVGGSAIVEAARDVVEQARRLAADRLEASPADVEFDDGAFRVTGAPDRSLLLGEVAGMAHDSEDSAGLSAESSYDPPSNAYAFGTHVAVVEVDPGTGETTLEDYVAVDDCGVVINPMIVEGQIHGGIAQGIGQAMYEHAVYDEQGSLLTGTLMDYGLPRAMHVPDIETDHTVTPCPHNPLGAKGTGETGAIGAPPAVVNAIVDALEPFDVTHVDMPVTDETVWRAMAGSP